MYYDTRGNCTKKSKKQRDISRLSSSGEVVVLTNPYLLGMLFGRLHVLERPTLSQSLVKQGIILRDIPSVFQ